MRLLSSESISQITSVSTFSSERVRLGSGPEVLIQTVLYKRKKKRSSAPSPSFATENQFPSPQIFLWSLCGRKSCHLFIWQQEMRMKSGFQSPRLRCASDGHSEIKHGVPSWGQPDWREANVPFSTTATFAYFHSMLTEPHPYANANCVFTCFPNWKGTFLSLRCLWVLWCYCLRTVCMKEKELDSYGCKWRFM